MIGFFLTFILYGFSLDHELMDGDLNQHCQGDGYGCAILALDTPFNRQMLQNGKHGGYLKNVKRPLEQIVGKSEDQPLLGMEEFRKEARFGFDQKY